MSIDRNTFRRTSIRFGFVYELFWKASSSFDSESLYQQILKISQIPETLWNCRHISKHRYSLWFRSRKLSSKIELIARINCFETFPTTDWFKKSNFQRCITSTDYNRVRSHEITKKNTSIVRRTMSNTIRVSDIVIRGYYVLIKFPFFFVRFVSHSTNDKSSWRRWHREKTRSSSIIDTNVYQTRNCHQRESPIAWCVYEESFRFLHETTRSDCKDFRSVAVHLARTQST